MFFIETIKKKLTKEAVKKAMKPSISKALTALAAVLVATGIADQDLSQEFVTVNTEVLLGAVAFGVARFVKWLQNKKEADSSKKA